jgi:nucleotide-binding universal stress UspA family protein
MSSTNKIFVILVGIDFSDLADHALDQALEVACLHEEAEVHVVYVDPDIPVHPAFAMPPATAVNADTMLEQVQQRAAEHTNALGSRLDGGRLKRVVAHFRRGAPAVEIAQLAAHLDADLVVVGSHGHRGIQRLLLGSVAERVARLARCPVWIVRPKDHSTDGRVPEIEPPCPDCVRTREETSGATLWCARHAEHHIRPHRYAYTSNGIYAGETAAYGSTPEGR